MNTHPKTRTTITLPIPSILLVYFSLVPPTIGQSLDRAKGARGALQGAKPGEIITAPNLSERWRDQLKVGETAPEFTLPLASGPDDAKLIAQRGEREAVTKGNSARALEGIDDVCQDLRERAGFLFVYVCEAHPDSVLYVVDDKQTTALTRIPQAVTLKDRNQAAVACGLTLNLEMPIAVDSIDNKVGRALRWLAKSHGSCWNGRKDLVCFRSITARLRRSTASQLA